MLIEKLQQTHHDSSRHRALIERSKLVGCFYCRQTFPPSEIKGWIDDGETAVCPKCGIDSILPDSVDLSPDFLRAMYDHWFSITGLESHP
jgi:hypothetical protein